MARRARLGARVRHVAPAHRRRDACGDRLRSRRAPSRLPRGRRRRACDDQRLSGRVGALDRQLVALVAAQSSAGLARALALGHHGDVGAPRHRPTLVISYVMSTKAVVSCVTAAAVPYSTTSVGSPAGRSAISLELGERPLGRCGAPVRGLASLSSDQHLRLDRLEAGSYRRSAVPDRGLRQQIDEGPFREG
jgi:hypothetical protein